MNSHAISTRIKASLNNAILKVSKVPSTLSSNIQSNLNQTLNEEVDVNLPVVEKKEEIVLPAVIDGAKVKRYISRGVEDVGKIISDLNFDLKNSMKFKSADIKSINFPEDGSSIVEIQTQYELSNPDIIQYVGSEAKNYSLRDEFSQFVSYSILPPDNVSPTVSVSTKIKIPSEVVEELIGSPSGGAWGKRGRVIEKYAKSLLSSFNKV